MLHFNLVLARIGAAWLMLMSLFLLARIVFFCAFLPHDFFSETSLQEILKVFFLAMRFDSSVATQLLVVPVTLALFFGFIPQKIVYKYLQRAVTLLLCSVTFMSCLIVVVSHY